MNKNIGNSNSNLLKISCSKVNLDIIVSIISFMVTKKNVSPTIDTIKQESF